MAGIESKVSINVVLGGRMKLYQTLLIGAVTCAFFLSGCARSESEVISSTTTVDSQYEDAHFEGNEEVATTTSTARNAEVLNSLVGMTARQAVDLLYATGFEHTVFPGTLSYPFEDRPVTAVWPSDDLSKAAAPNCVLMALDPSISEEDLARGWKLLPDGASISTATQVAHYPECQSQAGITLLSAEEGVRRRITTLELKYWVDQINERQPTPFCIQPHLRWGWLSSLDDHPVGCTAGQVATGDVIGLIEVSVKGCYAVCASSYETDGLAGKIREAEYTDFEPWLFPSPRPLCPPDKYCPLPNRP
jgi:hypothetical protein